MKLKIVFEKTKKTLMINLREQSYTIEIKNGKFKVRREGWKRLLFVSDTIKKSDAKTISGIIAADMYAQNCIVQKKTIEKANLIMFPHIEEFISSLFAYAKKDC